MRISLYTAMRNCLSQDYPCVEMLEHHLPLVDEIIVNDGFSTDGTFEALQAVRNRDRKVKIFRTKWEEPNGENWWIHFKDAARRQCSGDWCIHLDADEFIPEWDFDAIRNHLSDTGDIMVPVQFTNFYGNHRVYHSDPAKSHWVTRKMIIHRNLPDRLEFWGDGSNVKLAGQEFHWDTSARQFDVHHFGGVRNPARLREAWWLAGRFRTGRSIKWHPPKFVFDMFPHDWADPDFYNYLAIYHGPAIKAVRENPSRFAGDGYRLLQMLSKRDSDQMLELAAGPIHARTAQDPPACADPVRR